MREKNRLGIISVKPDIRELRSHEFEEPTSFNGINFGYVG